MRPSLSLGVRPQCGTLALFSPFQFWSKCMSNSTHQQPDRTARTPIAVGLALGIAVGAGLGAAIGSIAMGVGIGVALGVALGVAMDGPRRSSGE
jgi:hypothetical protein